MIVFCRSIEFEGVGDRFAFDIFFVLSCLKSEAEWAAPHCRKKLMQGPLRCEVF